MKNRVKQWFRTIELSGHAMAEQAYDISNLAKIARFIEKHAGCSAGDTIRSLKKTSEFHRKYGRV